MKLPFKTTSGFTLLELMISMTIFGVMSVAIMSVYIQTTNLGQKMRMSRYLSETAREITERIADDVREKGITITTIPSSLHIYWNGVSGYTQSGTEMIEISNSGYRYIYGRKSSVGVDPCDSLVQKDIKIHCGLYKVIGSDYAGAWNLVDSFVPEEEKKRVKIEDLKFYISGDGLSSEKKVTLIFTLILMPRIGIPAGLIQDTRLHVQTTISERFFKN